MAHEFAMKLRNKGINFAHFVPPECGVHVSRRPSLNLLGRVVVTSHKVDGGVSADSLMWPSYKVGRRGVASMTSQAALSQSSIPLAAAYSRVSSQQGRVLRFLQAP
jgi:hypothetical protein